MFAYVYDLVFVKKVIYPAWLVALLAIDLTEHV